MPPKLGTERGTGNRTCSGCASDPDVVAAVLIDQPVIGIELDPGAADFSAPRPQGNDRSRPRGALRGRDTSTQSGRPAPHRSLPPGFHVPTDVPRDRRLEITDCDIQSRTHGGTKATYLRSRSTASLCFRSVLTSERAVQVNIAIMRAFGRLRSMLLTQVELARRLDDLEARYDQQFEVVFDAIRELVASPPDEPSHRIGFDTD